MNKQVTSNLPPEINEIEAGGCVNIVSFNWDSQALSDVDNIVKVAEKHTLAMAQGLNGYVEVWVDDDKKYRCQTTDFTSIKKGSGTEAITVRNEASLQIGSKEEAEAWLKEWWLKLNQLEPC
ncbi:MAG: hypothetical protein V7749_00885 [Cocleimonas sp.]